MVADTEREVVAYEKDGAIVVCERRNPNAWIRSDLVVDSRDLGRQPVYR